MIRILTPAAGLLVTAALLAGCGGSPNNGNGGSANLSSPKNAGLKMAECMRAHGVPSFPDPSTSGEITHEMVASAGINLNQPAVLQAGDACVGVTHGAITKAIVARFVAGH